jgi:cytochrome b6-f complex iron-sulfur subunit
MGEFPHYPKNSSVFIRIDCVSLFLHPVDPHNSSPGRRSVLNWLLGLSGGGVFGAVLYPVARYLAPPDVPEAATQSVTAGSAQALAPNSGRVVAFGSRPAIVIRTAAGDVRAFAATCTHLDCTVQYRPDMQRIWCACHNGQYDLNGRNVAGPPPRPLEPYDVNVKDDQITLTRRS